MMEWSANNLRPTVLNKSSQSILAPRQQVKADMMAVLQYLRSSKHLQLPEGWPAIDF